MYRLFVQTVVFLSLCYATGYIFSKNNLNFIIGAIVGGAFQFVFNYIYLSVFDAIIALKNKNLENERIKEFSMQGLVVECPCSRKIRDFVPIRLNTANKYKCKECMKLISIYVTPSTALSTEPIVDTDTVNPSILSNG
jgi:hypothetical protein